jgi:hypothetical protein
MRAWVHLRRRLAQRAAVRHVPDTAIREGTVNPLECLKFRRGGMAEWSMAVVLKTSPDRLYQDGYISAANFTPTCARFGQILRDLPDLPVNPDNRSAGFHP